MPLQIKDEGSVPSERWHYRVEATNHTVYAPNFPALYPEIVKHCKANTIDPPSQQDVIDWLCANLRIHCVQTETRQALVNKFTLNLPVPVASGCCR